VLRQRQSPSFFIGTLQPAFCHMELSRSPINKQPKGPASASATSRKNKLQRCSVCGGLGHKSRTCDQAIKMGVDLGDCLNGPIERRKSPVSDDDLTDLSDVRAAYGLVALSRNPSIDLEGVVTPPRVESPEPVAAPAPPIPAPALPEPLPLAPPPQLPPPPQLAPLPQLVSLHHHLAPQMSADLYMRSQLMHPLSVRAPIRWHHGLSPAAHLLMA